MIVNNLDNWTPLNPCEGMGVYNTFTAIILSKSINGLDCEVSCGLHLILDFFDNSMKPPPTEEHVEEPVQDTTMAEKLPEGFFDDPKKDAKVEF